MLEHGTPREPQGERREGRFKNNKGKGKLAIFRLFGVRKLVFILC